VIKVLLDTNVVLDAIANREPFHLDAQKIIKIILDNELDGYITANSITDIYYIARKYLTKVDLYAAMRSLFIIFSVIDVLGADCHKALDFSMDDYEDALLAVCGNKVDVNYIITRDKEFMEKAKSKLSITVISPADFLANRQ